MRYEGGPLDGRDANITTKGAVRIPIYGNGYGRKPTKILVYERKDRKLVFKGEEKP